jgi:hypothetical protein
MSGTEVRNILEGMEERIRTTLGYYDGKISNYTKSLQEVGSNLSLIEAPDNGFQLVSGQPKFKNGSTAAEFNAHIAKIQELAADDEQLDKKFTDSNADLNRGFTQLFK